MAFSKSTRVFITAAFLSVIWINGSLAQVGKTYMISGKLPDIATGYIYLQGFIDGTDAARKDSCLLKNGVFIFKGTVPGTVLGRLIYKRTWCEVFIEPGIIKVISNTEDISAASIAGSKAQQEYELLNAALKKIDDRWKVVIDTLHNVNKRSNVQYQELRDWVLVPYFKERLETEYAFYDKYPASYATAYSMLVTGREMSTDTLQMYYGRLAPEVKQSRFGKDIYKQVEARKIGIPGTMAALFTRTDINGNKLSLTDLRGKYVLLDFWGSWCVPCRKGHPHLKQVYAQYKDKGVEFIGVADDDRTLDAWHKAVAVDGLPWLQVLRNAKAKDDISEIYNVAEYPTRILIDKQGKIIGRFTEDTTELDKMLKGLL
jgi:thiol-disulfide isomerase/thioredoxin